MMPMRETLLFSTVTGNFNLKGNQYHSSPFLEYEKTRRMTEIDFISNVGGLFGLCLGLSMIYFIEIVYWFVIKTIKNLGG